LRGQPDYLYPSQWADELASAYTMTAKSAPALSNDLSQIPIPSSQKAQIASALLQSQLQPYGPQQ